MRDRLIKLILNTPVLKFPSGSRAQGKTYQTAQNLADHLLANGVIVLPCKVGDNCYPLPRYRTPIVERKVSRITYSARNIIICYYENDGQYRPPLRTRILGEDVFLTKEEAEKAHAERSGK